MVNSTVTKFREYRKENIQHSF